MNFRIIELPETELIGVSFPYEGQGYRNREELRSRMWSEAYEDVPHQISGGHWNEPGSTVYDGVWYGVWQGGRYMIARNPEDTGNHELEHLLLPAGTYAAFTTEKGTPAWEEFPRLFDLIFHSWLPSSPYRQKGDVAVEALHLWTDHDLRKKNKYYEVWIPIEPR